MPKRKIVFFLLFFLPLATLVTLAADFALFLKKPLVPPTQRVVSIPPGSAFQPVAEKLAEEGIINRPLYFSLLARYRKDTAKIHAGQYLFKEPARPTDILDRLVAGDVIRYAFTVPEGLTMTEIALRIERESFGSAEEFIRLAHSPDLVSALNVPADSLEGYLFPETYLLEKESSERRLLLAMVEEFRLRALPAWREAAAARGLSLHEWVTLASIIQKESGKVKEMPLISAVFHNRLEHGIPLQADPTVIYGIENFDGNLTRKHLRTPTPYNTYTNRGLPPGPICNPGAEALKAAAFPARVDYLYFVSRGDGTHYFSSTLAEHNKAVRKFQLKR